MKTCIDCGTQFTVDDADRALYAPLDMPDPVQCVRCRWRHLASFWVFGRFRVAKSALSGKTIITNFPESVPFPLYDHTEFASDAWDPTSYATEYDSSRSFIEQFRELQSKVPHPHNSGMTNVACDWCDDVWSSRECYLSRSMLECEFVSYGYRMLRCKNSIDITYCFDVENCFDVLNCFKCYGVSYSFNAHDCIESAFLFDCKNCSNCFMSWNLKNKQYCIMNEQYSKDEYTEKLKEFDTRSRAGVDVLKEQFSQIIREQAIHRADFNVQTTDVSGNFINKSKNVHDSYFIDDSENVRHSVRGIYYKNIIDSVGSKAEKAALSVTDFDVYGTVATSHCSQVLYSAYTDYCENLEYCFGCVGLRKKKFCILNKQYDEEEYKILVEKIKADMKARGEWGIFWPRTMAYSGYNLSLAQMLFPITKEVAEAGGWQWNESEVNYPDAIPSDALPDTIDEVTDEITKKRIICPETKLSYNIAPKELEFYREHDIPLPRRHFDHRTLERFRPLALMITPQQGVCHSCSKEITHYYDPELGYQKIVCVECYQQQMS